MNPDRPSPNIPDTKCKVARSLGLPILRIRYCGTTYVEGGMSGVTTQSTRDDSDHMQCLRGSVRARRLLAPLWPEKHRPQLMRIALVRPGLWSPWSGPATPTAA